MKIKGYIVFVVLLLSTLFSNSQNRDGMQEQSSEQRAQNFVKRLKDRIPLSSDKKDSLIIAFKSFYDELQTYQSVGNLEIVKVLSQKRDANVKHILADDEKYTVYQKYMEDIRLEREKRQQEHRDGGHHSGGRGMYSRP
jgi:hypothetical protein